MRPFDVLLVFAAALVVYIPLFNDMRARRDPAPVVIYITGDRASAFTDPFDDFAAAMESAG